MKIKALDGFHENNKAILKKILENGKQWFQNFTFTAERGSSLRKFFFYLTTHSTHFIYAYMASEGHH